MKYFILVLALFVGSACEREAERMEREPDPTDLWIVNTQPYFYDDMGPVSVAYDAVARHLEWDTKVAPDGQLMIDYWRDFAINSIIRLESGGCPYVRGGTLYNAAGDSCDNPAVRGRRSDTGFGQVTPVLFKGKNTVICKATGMCTWQQILVSPWHSMLATLVTIQELGSGPWCYDANARNYHNCSAAPDK